MSLVAQTLKKQKRVYFSYLWRGLALMGIGIFCGIMIINDGIGTAVYNGHRANILIEKLMTWLTGRGLNAEMVVAYGMIGLFFLIAAIGLFNVVRGLWLMAPTHSMLGKSVLQQAKPHEQFSDVMDSIHADMDQEPQIFGTVAIGRKWLLDTEVMRLSEIRGVFWFDQSMGDHVLCCVDEALNIWAASLRYSNERDKAAEYLMSKLPDAASGDKDVYMAYLSSKMNVEEQPDPSVSPAPPTPCPASITLSGDAAFCFVCTEGIPTSNFTYEGVLQALRSLEGSQTITLRVLAPANHTVSEIFFSHLQGRRNVGVIYRKDDEQCRMEHSMSEEEAEAVLEEVMKYKQLNVSRWQE